MSRFFKKSLLVLLVGVMCQFGGCGFVLRDLVLDSAWDFVLDDDILFDIFGDDGPGLVTQ